MFEKMGQYSKQAFGLLALLLLTASFFLLMGGINKIKEYRYIGKPLDYKNTITMSGEGKVVAVPDVIKLTFGYTTSRPKVAEAQQETVNKMNAFTDVLKNKGVEDKDIRTVNYSIYPQYDYVRGAQQLSGYTVTQNIEVTLRDLDLVSTILSVAAESELNQVGSLRFTFDDEEKFLQEARIKAIAAAKAKADSLAREAGVKLGNIISINENSGSLPQPYYNRVEAYGLGEGDTAAPAPDISAGSNEISVTVNLTYEVL